MEKVTLLTWRVPRCDATELEQATIPVEGMEVALAKARDRLGVTGIFYLGTCQRVAWLVYGKVTPESLAETYRELWSREPARPERMEGFQAFHHLCEVASSLDSLVPGEPQVLGQVKGAVRRWDHAGLLGAELRHVLDLVLRTAKEVRSRTSLFKGKVSLVGLAETVIADALRNSPSPRAAVLGTGEIGGKGLQLIRRLRPDTELHVVSRRLEHAKALAARANAVPHDLASFLANPPASMDLMVLALRTEQPILDEAALRSIPAGHDTTVLDLAMPRNAEVPSQSIRGLRLIQLDELVQASAASGARRAAAYEHARARLDDAVDRVRHDYDLRCHASTLHNLSQRFDRVMETRWAQARGRVDTQDPKVRKWFEQTVRALLHEATTVVKRPGDKP